MVKMEMIKMVNVMEIMKMAMMKMAKTEISVYFYKKLISLINSTLSYYVKTSRYFVFHKTVFSW